MGHQEAGDPTSYPVSAQILDNGDSDDASTWNVPFEALLDRTAWLRSYIERMLPPFSHWNVMSGTTNIDIVKFNQTTRDWYGMSRTVSDKFQRTKEYAAWPGTTEISGAGVILSPGVGGDFEFNPAGHGVIMCNGTDNLQEYNGTTWSRVDGMLGFDPSNAPRGVTVKWSPGESLWCIAFNCGAGQPPRAFTSGDRVNWTGVAISTFPNDTEVKIGSDGASTLVAVGRKTTDVHFARSTDGGVTWSAIQTIATGLSLYTGIPQVEPVWTGTQWLAVAFSSGTSNLYGSADGLTWTLLKAFTGVVVQSLCAIGPWLVAGRSNGDMMVSNDGGTTWNYCDRRFGSAALNTIVFTGSRLIASGGGVFMVANGLGPTTSVVP
jgi:hypothetical protein